MRMKTTYQDFWHRLARIYDEGEAKAIARTVYETRYGLSLADLCMGRDEQIAHEEELQQLLERLEQQEPVQYVLGEARFCNRTFHVEPGVLIPRPETEELCRLVSTVCRPPLTAPSILDIGTGSGCIACTLAAGLSTARVTAWDISDVALRTAATNAERLGTAILTVRQDALHPPHDTARWDVIVSNPPYVAEHERAAMAPHVKDHEPPEALFVSDADPLLFYRAIAHYAAAALRPGGSVYFEINPLYKDELERLLADAGLTAVETRPDQFGKPRMTKACRPKHP